MSGSSFGEVPRSRSVEGCPTAWSSSDVNSRSGKVTHQYDPVGLCIGDQAWLTYFPQWDPTAPLVPPLGPSSWLVQALGMVADIQPPPSS